MKHISTRRLLVCTLPLMLTACDSVDDWLNRNMPVVGQRCEHWQCFTEGGQQQSDLNHQERVQREAGGGAPAGAQYPAGNPASGNPVAGGTPPQPGTAPAAPAAAPAASSAPDTPTYSYVPRAPSAPGTTPFDGAIPPPAQQ